MEPILIINTLLSEFAVPHGDILFFKLCTNSATVMLQSEPIESK